MANENGETPTNTPVGPVATKQTSLSFFLSSSIFLRRVIPQFHYHYYREKLSTHSLALNPLFPGQFLRVQQLYIA